MQPQEVNQVGNLDINSKMCVSGDQMLFIVGGLIAPDLTYLLMTQTLIFSYVRRLTLTGALTRELVVIVTHKYN